MIQIKKLYSIFFFFSLCCSPLIEGMEEQCPKAENSISSEQKTKKKRVRHKKKKANDQNSKSALDPVVKNQIKTERKKLREIAKIDNIKKSINADEYEAKFNILANLLLMQSWLIKELKEMAIHSVYMLDNSAKVDIPRETVLKMLKIEKECLDLAAFYQDEQNTKNMFFLACKFKGDDFYSYIINRISSHWLAIRVNLVCECFLTFLSNIIYANPDDLSFLKKALAEKTMTVVVEDWLRDNKVDKITKDLLPSLIAIFNKVIEFRNYYNKCRNDKVNFYITDTAEELFQKIAEIIVFYMPFEIVYKDLYCEIISQIKNNKYRTVYMVPDLESLPKNLEVPTLKFDFNPDAKYFEANFIENIIKNHTKKAPQIASESKNKKRSRRRNHTQKDKALEEKSLNQSREVFNLRKISEPKIEYIELPHYKPRILKWFDPKYVEEKNANQSSVFYHTYCLLIDWFNQKWGYKCFEQNTKNPNEFDAVYYIACEIKDKNGNAEWKVLKNSYLIDGSCYHRGPADRDIASDIYKKLENSIIYQENRDASKAVTKVIKLNSECLNANLYKDLKYREAENYIEIYDSVHEVTFVLFKCKETEQAN